jgi:outer membrane protein assembly factor BamE
VNIFTHCSLFTGQGHDSFIGLSINILYDFNFCNHALFQMKKSLCLFSVAASFTLTACSTMLGYLPVYTIDIQQGNIVDQTMIDQLQPNMTKRQVLYVLGSPMLNDAFHQKRWDYIYSEQRNGEDRQQKKITLLFNDAEKISGIQGDFKPGKAPQFKPTVESTVDVPKRDLEKSVWEKIIGVFGFDGNDDAPKAVKENKNTENNLPL